MLLLGLDKGVRVGLVLNIASMIFKPDFYGMSQFPCVASLDPPNETLPTGRGTGRLDRFRLYNDERSLCCCECVFNVKETC